MSDRGGLERLQQEWNELLLASAHPTVFHTWEWMTTWLDRFGEGGTPHVLVDRAPDGRLRALAPLFRAAGPPWTLRTVRLMGTGVGADHLGFVIRRGEEDEACRNVTDHLLARPGWDALEFVRADGDFARRVQRAVTMSAQPLPHALVEADRCPYIALPGTWDEYLATIGPHRRSELGRQGRRLDRQGAVVIRRAESPGDLAEIWAALIQLHQDRRDAVAAGQSAFVAEDTRRFHEAFAKLALQRGWLRLYLMTVNGQPIAAECAYTIGGYVTDYQGGFDMAWAKFGVGTLLTAHAIRQAIAEGAVEFDFLRGAEEYKQQRWGAQVRTDMTVSVWRRDARVSALRAAHRFARAARDRVRRAR